MGLLSVVVDKREPTWCQQLSFGGIPTTTEILDAGDILALTDDGAVLAIERKEVSDFLHSLRDERLWSQLARLRELTPWAYLALCGAIAPGPDGMCYVDGRDSQWKWASVAGALLTVQEIGIHVLWVSNDADFEASVLRLAGRDRSTHRVRPARDITTVSDAEAILGSLPGVGTERAKALTDYSGSVAWALQLLTDDTMTSEGVPGIGGGVKRRVRRALGLDDRQQLAVVLKETVNPAQTQRVVEKVA